MQGSASPCRRLRSRVEEATLHTRAQLTRYPTSLAEVKPVGERVRQARVLDCLRGFVDRVLDPVPLRGAALQVEQHPRSTRVAITRLAHPAGVDQPLALRKIYLHPAARLLADGAAALVAPEPERDVRMANRAKAPRHYVHARVGQAHGEHVFPDRVTRARVVQLDVARLVLGRELL